MQLAHRLEHDQRAEDVDLGPQDRVGPADRHLQSGQVDHVGDLMPAQGPLELLQVGDIPLDEGHLGQLLVGQHHAQPAQVLLEIVDPDLVAPFQQMADNPAADAAVAAGQQYTHESLLALWSAAA